MIDYLDHNSLSMTVLMTPDKANFAGNVHGGDLLKLLDQVAYGCGSRYCSGYVVTFSVNQVLFKHAISVGEHVSFLAHVNYTGKTSMEIGIKVIAEDMRAKTVRHTNTCYFTMVSVDEDGKPTPVPPRNPQTEEEIRRFEAGKQRRMNRAKPRTIVGRLWTLINPALVDQRPTPINV